MPRKRRAALRPTALRLRGLQRWFQEEIFRPNVRPQRARPASVPPPDAVVLPSRTLTADERVGIYAGMYHARLHDCLAADYPAVARLLGPEAFARLARAYLSRHPSQHYSLNVLGRDLPHFLAGPARVPRRALVHDVARLELAMARVFDAEESPVLAPRGLRALTPGDLGRARLVPIAAFELLELDYPVNALVSAARQEKELPPAPRRRSRVCVYRKRYAVWRMDLTEPMFVLLRALAAGKTIAAAVGAAARVFRGRAGALEKSIFEWFREWTREGLFRAVEVAGERGRASRGRGRAGRGA